MPDETPVQPALALDAPGAVTPPAVSATPAPEPVAAAPTKVDPPAIGEPPVDDAVESWLSAHPEQYEEVPADQLPTEPVATDVTPAPPTETKPVAETPPTTEAPAPVEGEKPAETAPIADAPKPAEQPAPPAPTYAADEKFALAANPDGSVNEWTRGQLVEVVKEAFAIRPKAEQADEFARIFGMDAPTAKERWEPVLARLSSEPDTAALIETVFTADPAKREYLARADAKYEEAVANGEVVQQQPARPAQPAIAPELQARLDRIDGFISRQELAEATQQFNALFAQATAQYPFLATNDKLRGELLETANLMYEVDKANGVRPAQRRGLREAVASKASIYDALRISAAPQPEPVVEAPAPVPATLGASGAAVTTTPRDDGRPRIFKNGEDPTEEWLRTHPE